MPTDDARARLSAREDAMVRALLADGPPPPGIDPGALARARAQLTAKRAWVSERRARCKAPPPAGSLWARLLGRLTR